MTANIHITLRTHRFFAVSRFSITVSFGDGSDRGRDRDEATDAEVREAIREGSA